MVVTCCCVVYVYMSLLSLCNVVYCAVTVLPTAKVTIGSLWAWLLVNYSVFHQFSVLQCKDHKAHYSYIDVYFVKQYTPESKS